MRSMSAPPAQAAVILAAGKGTRMGGDLPKVLHPIAGRPMVLPVIEACRAVACDPIVVVVGYRQDLVRDAIGTAPDLRFAVQEPQLGTGHAAQCARQVLGDPLPRQVLVLAGDGPLIRPATLRALLERHRSAGAAGTIATSIIDDPTGYGRIVRDGAGAFREIVEHRNASPAQRAIREVNPSYYCFDGAALFGALPRVQRNETSGEYYLTDVLALLLADGRRVEVVPAVPPEDVLSINTPEELARVDRVYRERAPSEGSRAHAPRRPSPAPGTVAHAPGSLRRPA